MNSLNAKGTRRFMDKILIELEPDDFIELVKTLESRCIVIHSVSSKLIRRGKIHKYVMPYQGVLFFCKCDIEIKLPENAKLINIRDFNYPDI